MASTTALAAYKAGRRAAVPRHRAHRKAKMTIPLALVAGLVPTAIYCYEGAKASSVPWSEVSHRLTMRVTGYDRVNHKWDAGELMRGWTPIILGMLVHSGANKLGINRQLSRMGIPLLRI
jgi:hypothetical protein